MLVYGKNACLEYLEKNQAKKIYLQRDFRDEKILNHMTIPPQFVDKKFLDQKCKGVHQGILIEVEDFCYTDIDSLYEIDDATLVLLDHLEDPHNLGAIIRTAEACGITGIVIPRNRSVEVNATVLKTSAGAASNLPICRVTNLNDAISKLKTHGFWIIGTDMDGEDFKTMDYRGKIAIVIGNEGRGISDLVRKNCDFIASIPMYGKVNSLNASVAAGLMIYEAIRNKGE